MSDKQNPSTIADETGKRAYRAPELKIAGTLAELTQGFSGSLPDEQGGMTKRNPFQG